MKCNWLCVALIVLFGLTLFLCFQIVLDHPFGRDELNPVNGNLRAAYKLDWLIEKADGEYVLAEKSEIVHTPKDSPDDKSSKRIELNGIPFLYRWPPPSGEKIVFKRVGDSPVQPKVRTILAFTVKPVHGDKRFVMFLDQGSHGFAFVADQDISWYFQKWRTDLDRVESAKLNSLGANQKKLDGAPN